MDRPEEEIMTRKGDQYAKRLLVRKKDLNQSYESFSKSLRRRKKIMDAISKHGMTAAAAAAAATSNKTELANSDEEEQDKSYVSTWPENIVEKRNLPAVPVQSYPAGRSCSPSELDEIHYRRSSSGQFQRDLPAAGLSHQAPALRLPPNRSRCTKLQPKNSLREHLSAKSDKEVRASERPSGNGKAKQEQERQLVSARILQVLEPEVVHVEREWRNEASKGCHRLSNANFLRDLVFPSAPPEPALPVDEADSTLASLVSAEQTKSGEQLVPPADTPKRMYPSLSSMERRMSDRHGFVSKKLYFESAATPAEDRAYSTPHPPEPAGAEREEATAPPITGSIVDESTCYWGTPMPMAMSNEPLDDTAGQSPPRTSSRWAKQARRRRDPDLESTRKQSQLSASQLPMHGTSISTLTLPNTPGSPAEFGAEAEDEPTMRTAAPVPHEVEDFLKLALGEEYRAGSSCCSSPPRDRSTPKASKQPQPSALLDRSWSIYKSLSSSIRRRFKARGKREPRLLQRRGGEEEDARQEMHAPRVKRLLDLMEVYQTQIYQASKALDLCETMREFQASGERVEVERLLLLASLGKLATREEMGRLGGAGAGPRGFFEHAELTIAELSVPMREDLLRWHERLPGHADDCVEWFVLVVREGLRVWASQAVAYPLGSPRLHFPGRLSLPELAPDFRLSVGVYSMRLQCPARPYNHEDKYHIENEDAEAAAHHQSWPCPCPSPQRLLGGGKASAQPHQPVRSPKRYHVGFSGVKRSGFLLRASLELGLDQLDPPRSTWPLCLAQDQPRDSALQASLDMELRCRLRLSARHAGFLTFGNEPGGVIDWSRRWCALEGRNLLFWNYPGEQEDDKPPLHAIDLMGCLSRRVELAERSLCPRPRTLLIETARRRSPADEDGLVLRCRRSWTIVRHLLACDSQEDLLEWHSKINYVVSALRDWRLVAVPTADDSREEPLQVSDL